MNFSFAVSNSTIRKHTAEIQKNNTWSIIGALIVSGLISGSVSSLISYVLRYYGDPITDPTISVTLLVTIFTIIQFVVSALMSMGVNWAAVESVDSGEFQFKTIFQPFSKRPARNVLAMIMVNLMVMAVTLLLIVPVMAAVVFLMPDAGFNLPIDPYIDVFSNNVFAVFWGLLLYILVVVLITAYVNYIYALITYLPYDFNHLGARQILKVSRRLMKGNKLKLFRLQFYYGFMTVLLVAALISVIGYAAYSGADPWLVAILGIGITIISFILMIRLAIRLLIANAVFYRTILDENEDKLAIEIPELELKALDEQISKADFYHTEPRPNLYGDAVAVQPTEDGTPNLKAEKPVNSGSQPIEQGIETAAIAAAITDTQKEGEQTTANSAAASIISGNDTTAVFTATPDSQKEIFQAIKTAADVSEKKIQSEGEKKPYDIMGYNTPEHTDFTTVNNHKEVFIAAEKAQEDGLAAITEHDFMADEDPGTGTSTSNKPSAN